MAKMQKCPVCGASLRVERLPAHLASVHPRAATGDQVRQAERRAAAQHEDEPSERRRRRKPFPLAVIVVLVVTVLIVLAAVLFTTFLAGRPLPDIEDPLACVGPGAQDHFHPWLKITIDGSDYPGGIPSTVGTARCPSGIGIIHTHVHEPPRAVEIDADGFRQMHYEGPPGRTYRLGDFFEVWEVPFTSSQIGSYTTLNGDLTMLVGRGLTAPLSPNSEFESLVVYDGTRVHITFTTR